MSSLSKLPHYQKRQFISENIDLTSVETVKKFYTELIKINITSTEQFEQWLLHRSELEAALDQTGSILYIEMTCQTDDTEKADAYKNFIEIISPVTKPLNDQLNQQYFKALEQFPLDEQHYAVLTRATKADIELFVEKNVELQTKVELLSQEYQTICGGMTVEFDGQERTLPEMGKFLLEPDRNLRERAWKASAARRLKEKDKLDDIFDRMLHLRHTIAQNADCQNFCEYKFRSLQRFDYTPEQCKEYHTTVEQIVLPLWKEILKKRQHNMKLDYLKPWDTAVDPLGREPLKPFEKVSELINGCQKIFNHVDPQLGAQFQEMQDLGVLDLESRKGKAPGGYQSTLNESRKPFIFMNAVGVDSDINTLLHEGGHAFHALACAHDSLLDYRHGPMEFCEVASMGMELLAGEYLSEFYNKEDAQRSRMDHLEDALSVLVWVATIDAFQHWIYENPKHTASDRKKAWLDIHNRFSTGCINWGGQEEEHAYLWHRQLHIFEVPFYYIEYGIAQLGALQLWFNAKKDWDTALGQYRQALALGGSKPLPKLFETAGLQFDFSEKTIKPIVEAVKKELNFS
ncbi:Oligoendopeptidase F [hydrothermal vent metagenome]|uniref:Oligoendopeptidase F n=1 Tax=hydrothermal vent metagenome TaxID=652676 RepID=A0A3B1DEW1_9ZZZZ